MMGGYGMMDGWANGAELLCRVCRLIGEVNEKIGNTFLPKLFGLLCDTVV